jgi:hypothetical protein
VELEVEAKGWADVVDDGTLPDGAIDCERHEVALPWAVQNVEAPEVQRAALLGMLGCPIGHEHGAMAIETALGSPDLAVQGAALELAQEYLAQREQELTLVPLVASVLRHHEAVGMRYEALEALDTYTWTTDPVASDAMLHALVDDAPPVVSEALERARYRAAGIEQPLPWLATARFAARAHLDPGIRGRAALLMARLAPDDPSVRQQLREMLHDEHPYTRSAVAAAIATTGDLSAVHDLMTLVDDESPNGWLMLPWDAPSGRKRRQLHVGSHLERVDDAALRALEELTESMGEEGFRYREVQLKYLKLDLIAARRDAEAWYEAHRDELPSSPRAP